MNKKATRPPCRTHIATQSPLLQAHYDGHIAHITFNNPTRHNAIDLGAWQAIPPLFASCAELTDIRLIILRGAGRKAFVAGADISQFDDEFSGDCTKSYDTATRTSFDSIAQCPVPTLAAIEGYCMGGGVGIALACDLRIARTDSTFSIPAARLGLAYPENATQRLVLTVGMAKAMEILFTARRYQACDAWAMGLVTQLADIDEFDQKLDELAQEICQNAPLSLRAAKYAILKSTYFGDLQAYKAEIDRHKTACMTSADYKEGRRAFREKRKANFIGK